MPDLNALLDSVRQRDSRTGIVTADRYFREVEGCFGGGFCPVKIGAESQDQWQKALKDAERTLTYTIPPMRLDVKSIKASKNEEFIAEFDGITTSTRRDRDGDILETAGAQLDKDGPLLLHHMSMMPIGRGIRVLRHSSKSMKEQFGIADNELGRDTVPLVKARVLRISHGFDPIEFEPLKDDRGFHFTKFLIFERSLVSIPSNIDAVVTDFSEKDFKTALMKGWYDRQRTRIGKRKKSVVTVPADITETTDVDGEFTEVKQGDLILADDWNKVVRRLNELSKQKTEDNAEHTKAPACGCSKQIEQLQGELESLRNQQRSLEDIEREYIAELAKSDTDAVRKAHRTLSLMLRAAEDQEEAKEWGELLSQLT